ncbi:MAG: signal peptidase II [Pseudomonadales bacterium]
MTLWLALAGVVVVLDQWIKSRVVVALAYGDEIPVWSFFSLVRWHNEGAAFSMLGDAGGWQRWLFIALAVAFTAFLVFELRRLPPQQRLMGTVYALILGGAIGNLIDRVLLGHVVDFLLFHWGTWYFPAFNIADIALTTGALLWVGAMISEARQERRGNKSS